MRRGILLRIARTANALARPPGASASPVAAKVAGWVKASNDPARRNPPRNTAQVPEAAQRRQPAAAARAKRGSAVLRPSRSWSHPPGSWQRESRASRATPKSATASVPPPRASRCFGTKRIHSSCPVPTTRIAPRRTRRSRRAPAGTAGLCRNEEGRARARPLGVRARGFRYDLWALSGTASIAFTVALHFSQSSAGLFPLQFEHSEAVSPAFFTAQTMQVWSLAAVRSAHSGQAAVIALPLATQSAHCAFPLQSAQEILATTSLFAAQVLQAVAFPSQPPQQNFPISLHLGQESRTFCAAQVGSGRFLTSVALS